MAIAQPAELEPMVSDPDDYRPRSRWRLVADPGGPAGAVQDLCLIVEEIAVGDLIPLHRHSTDEMMVILGGRAEVTLAEERLEMGAGGTLFVPKKAVHGLRNVGEGPLTIHAVFPTVMLDFQRLGRNAAPGTESKAPSHTMHDAVTGDVWEVTDEISEPAPGPSPLEG
ncbi:MAG: cupin domain-containing protein [Actinomycetota bacterium]|nr:cupin domain-containing protein [Actinomycetota bacterium]